MTTVHVLCLLTRVHLPYNCISEVTKFTIMADRDEADGLKDQKTGPKNTGGVTPLKSPTFPSQHRSDYPQYSPFTTRSRKITSPSAGFPMSPAFDTADLSDSVTPNASPQVGRRRLVSTGASQEDRFQLTGQPPLFSPISRSSSTLSLCSNVSSVTTPIDKLTKHCKCTCLVNN